MRGFLGILVVGVVVATLLPAIDAANTTARVNNKAPTITGISLPASASPTAGGSTPVSVTVTVEDGNGANDMSSVAIEARRPDASLVASATLTTPASASGRTSTWTWSFTLAFHDAPGSYAVSATATDRGGDAAARSGSFTFDTLVAMNLASSSLDFGASADPGAASAVLPLGVTNWGNTQIDVAVSGTDLTESVTGATIPASAIAYSLDAGMAASAPLAPAAATLGAFDLAKGASSSKDLYWQLTIPSGDDQWIPGGTYAGTATISATSG